MPNAKIHRNAGQMVGALAAGASAVYAGQSPVNTFWETLGGSVAGRYFGLLPDVLEPATSGNHRQAAHSRLAGLEIMVFTPGIVLQAQAQLRAEADRLVGLRALAPTPMDASLLWLREITLRMFTGAVPAIPSSYLSHLFLDSRTPKGLPWL